MLKYVLILFVSIFAACAPSTPQILETNVFYRRDLPVQVVYDTTVEDPTVLPLASTFEGGGVLQRAGRYTFVISPKGGAKMDLLTITTCHREFSGEKLSPGFFGKNRFKYEFTPVTGIEDVPQCLIRMNVLDAKSGKHAWALFDIQDDETTLPATVTCDGVVSRSNGVTMCRSRAGLVQRVVFDEEVDFVPSVCHIDAPKGRVLELKMPLKECVFVFMGKTTKRIHRLTTVGHEGILIRETE